MTQEIINRQEYKYIVTRETYYKLVESLKRKLQADTHGNSEGLYTVFSLYYDTENDGFFHETINDHPFRQKLRLRSYQSLRPNCLAFLEIKKKYRKFVNKRRIPLNLEGALSLLNGERSVDYFKPFDLNHQIIQEIIFLRDYYSLRAKVMVHYQRQAFIGSDDSNLRVTFDWDLRKWDVPFSLEEMSNGDQFFPNGYLVLEVKTSNCLPLWLSRLLSDLHCYKQRYSKYCNSRLNDLLL